MNELNRPKNFGEILDTIFRLCKNYFSKFFMIFLIVIGPIYLLQVIVSYASGAALLRQSAANSQWFQNYLATINSSDATAMFASINLSQIWGTAILGLATIILMPVALGATIIAVNHIRQQREWTPGSVIKEAFSRFGPLLGTQLLLGLLAFAFIFAGMMIPFLLGLILGQTIHPALGIIIGILLFLGAILLAALILIRWSLALAAVAFEEVAPGLGKSWRLTQNKTWKTLGLFIVIGLITSIISSAINNVLIIPLGYSALYILITNLVALFVNMINGVAYGTIYLDYKTRDDGDDLKEMIADYEQ